MNRRLRRLAAIALSTQSLLAFALPASAAPVPAALTEQGRLFDGTGSPLNASVSVTFSIYADAAGGAPLWTETQMLTPDDGYFSAQIGADPSNPFPAGLWDGSARYVGVTIGNDAEMTPRQATGSVPYALLANDVNGDIHPKTISISGYGQVIDSAGNWTGEPSGLQGPAGPPGATGAPGPAGATGATGANGNDGAAGPHRARAGERIAAIAEARREHQHVGGLARGHGDEAVHLQQGEEGLVGKQQAAPGIGQQHRFARAAHGLADLRQLALGNQQAHRVDLHDDVDQRHAHGARQRQLGAGPGQRARARDPQPRGVGGGLLPRRRRRSARRGGGRGRRRADGRAGPDLVPGGHHPPRRPADHRPGRAGRQRQPPRRELARPALRSRLDRRALPRLPRPRSVAGPAAARAAPVLRRAVRRLRRHRRRHRSRR